LEKHPRHTWQSWRDRYLKQLRDRPPSAFNIPDNAPPSPPLDEPADPEYASIPTIKKEQNFVPKKVEPLLKEVGGPGRDWGKIYTVDDFDALFDTDDWEQLYANVNEIKGCPDDRYTAAWKSWAEGRLQTAEQWRQYFEKVVLPQWERDPVQKREKIRKEFEAKQEEVSSQKPIQGTQGQEDVEQETSELAIVPGTPNGESSKDKRERYESEDARFDHFLENHRRSKSSSAYFHYAREMKWSVWNQKPGLGYSAYSLSDCSCRADVSP
jgi:hypothetical protein